MGLTGGIGAGKSMVAELLVERGATLIDADLVAREVVAPDGPAYRPLVDRFGRSILADDGTVDRPALAAVAFSDPKALADLNAITHPAIGLQMIERRNALAHTDEVVVLAIPLLTPAHRETVGLDVVVVVDTPTEVALERLVEVRGMDRADAEARVAAQISREERLADADFVVDNSSTVEHLAEEADRLWGWLEERRRRVGDRS
ncbi:MAG TPA: dephospho-CoA kinase [Acidimicrobiales bacterium]|nr:dephospho-CoA kinase [Acidimicrobiales bacterium]